MNGAKKITGDLFALLAVSTLAQSDDPELLFRISSRAKENMCKNIK